MKLNFWKKDDTLPDLSTDFGSPTDPLVGTADPMSTSFPQPGALPPMNDPFAAPQSNAFSAPMSMSPEPAPMSAPIQTSPDQDMRMELVLARLDSIRNQLETLNQRLSNIERNQLSPAQGQARGPWYTPPKQ